MSLIVNWLLEKDIFPDTEEELVHAIEKNGGRYKFCRSLENLILNSPVIFYGSLGLAAELHRKTKATPGVFCNTKKFFCSQWYKTVPKNLLLQDKILFTNVSDFCRDPGLCLQTAGIVGTDIFVRPDSPLKPFSGRVINAYKVKPQDLDFGFYYDDLKLPIVVSERKTVESEWRFVIKGDQVITGSGYRKNRKKDCQIYPGSAPWKFACSIAKQLTPPDPLYIMDICESSGSLKLLELNPFSGADLYSCDRNLIVQAVHCTILDA